MKIKDDRRGVIGIVIFFLILFSILIIGVIAAIIISLTTYTSGVVTPVFQELGVIEETNTNLSYVGDVTFGTVDTLVGTLPWLMVFIYVSMLIFSVVFIVSWNYNPNPVYMGIYFLFVILLIFGSILMSNVYQDIYTGNDVLAEGLRNQEALSYLILYSPFILTALSMIVGIYVFVGRRDDYGVQGSYGV